MKVAEARIVVGREMDFLHMPEFLLEDERFGAGYPTGIDELDNYAWKYHFFLFYPTRLAKRVSLRGSSGVGLCLRAANELSKYIFTPGVDNYKLFIEEDIPVEGFGGLLSAVPIPAEELDVFAKAIKCGVGCEKLLNAPRPKPRMQGMRRVA